MKKIIYAIACCLLAFAGSVQAQQRINDGSSTGAINGGSILELQSNNKGLLLSKVSLTATGTWGLSGTAVAGMEVYNTNTGITSSNANYPALKNGIGIYYWDGTGWLASSAGATQYWGLNGNAGTTPANNFIGTTDTADLVFKVGNNFAGWIGGAANGESDAANSSLFQGAMMQMLTTNNGTAAGNVGNLAVGTNNQANTTGGSYNESFGHGCLQHNAGGSRNLAFGWAALENNLSNGNDNTAIGINALDNNNGSQNISVGHHSMYNNGSGSSNIAIGYPGSNSGYAALENNSTGSGNIAIGGGAGQTNNTGSNNTLIGNNADFAIDGLTDAVAIGNNAIVGESNALVLGGTDVDAVNVGIGTTTPSSTLHVIGSVSTPLRVITGDATLTANDFTVIKTSTSPLTITLPDPATCPGRIYSVINYVTFNTATSATADVTFSRPVITSTTGGVYNETSLYNLASNVIGASAYTIASIKIQSDGTNWYSIGL